MDIITAHDAALKWNISQRRVADFCSEGRIEGAEMIGNMWVIPAGTEKPIDRRTIRFQPDYNAPVRPFVKWAGGKSQILNDIQKVYPEELGNFINKYAEPFVGGGAVLFDILSKYDLDEIYISDINRELINTYSAIRDEPEDLILFLKIFQKEHIALDADSRKDYYYTKRDRFNQLKKDYEIVSAELAALFIYLNKTCFNGLYRVNSKGVFNVPSGVYKNPLICNEDNIRNSSKRLQNVNIVYGDYRKSIDFIDDSTFVYFDPPYRPLTETASFTAYTEGLFDDNNQRELAEYVRLLTEKGAKIAVSNSDPKNSKKDDEFFDDLYEGNTISRISANRMINSNGKDRGKISELLITNYKND
jgi:DNA adenine methylase